MASAGSGVSERKLSLEERALYESTHKASQDNSASYLSRHPELHQLIHDFTTAALATKPKDIKKYAKEYFSKFEVRKEQKAEATASDDGDKEKTKKPQCVDAPVVVDD
uniref:RIIa domain-containing protein n=1 Tax=Lotharella globosa TaxID=91324 RepID=A0A7S3YVS8_9EUKA|mmetsp:Transcript_17753/g.35806  ORF Transcript_17753/g.35806 Transcript_17753/m.35806 type:complete len:108 (+) Transcript_17753:43-366(+)|eukprot:CAMPEP_0167776044 /NCGR_PEP_ID=MMETSP0111_2-20121227/2906_1 /TAXON_ID=91324 /ORGANISM="Lotharella globosa, Strain CCCM811" /LENGTH=107 /DNA_ID=CAMNT_0007666047 /DNA_START=34 /DNA_END=357 /DNA_ORIENTATION=+